ncbi:antirestriction protein ArdA [Nesterenkonia aerolata]|uniref:Antirestriction protein ArdA n=1 Tax=Nesterenkonia aerolata TaxID=3074079 RepID=A0ABU2DVI5_9MICC|nr:antirestriction protein ArdA [Nesterenkonia sp. LY-0111]MDR8020406.1 antirestriction protein ArdA [Nesterenkonia sp. LY-0111]
MSVATITPAVWIGCLSCYNAGALTGAWFEATTADEIAPQTLHGHQTSHEELWVFDYEHLPIDGECSPHEAAKLARHLDEVDEYLLPVFLAWIGSGSHVLDGEDLPDHGEFIDRYCGHWDSFTQYAHQLAEDICLLADAPEHIIRYFNWSSWADDLEHDYTVLDASERGVYIFRDH